MSVSFDGSATYLSRASTLTGVSSSKVGTLSCWFKTSASSGTILDGANSGGSPIRGILLDLDSGALRITLINAASSTIWQATTSAVNDGEWHHAAASWNLATPVAHLYLDRVSDETEATAATDDTIPYASLDRWAVGATVDANTFWDGKMYDLLFWPGTFIDLSDSTALKYLVSSDGVTVSTTKFYQPSIPSGVKPVGYGHDLSFPTSGVKPSTAFVGNFATNRGTGGRFTLNGTWETQSSPDNPNAYRGSAKWLTPGQRWFDSEQSGFSYPRGETFIESREGHPAFGKRLGIDERDETTRDVGSQRAVSVSTLVRGPDEEDTEDTR